MKVLTVIQAKFSEMEFAVRKFHRPKNQLQLILMLLSNWPISNIAPYLNCHTSLPPFCYAHTFLKIGKKNVIFNMKIREEVNILFYHSNYPCQ